MAQMSIAGDDPDSPEVRALLEAHLAFARRHSPPEDVHALDVDGLKGHDISFFSVREGGELLGVGALKLLDASHAELKSIHTAENARSRGVGRAMVSHLIETARALGCSRVSLETGTMDAFAPSRALYAGLGFEECPPFGDYPASPNSVCMTLRLSRESDAASA